MNLDDDLIEFADTGYYLDEDGNLRNKLTGDVIEFADEDKDDGDQ